MILAQNSTNLKTTNQYSAVALKNVSINYYF